VTAVPDRSTDLRVGCVVLTTGERQDALAAALGSVHAQRGVEVELVVVHNAGEDAPVPEVGDATLLRPGRNLGIPAGRNLGARALRRSDLVLFLDDDGELVGDDVLVRAAQRFASDDRLAVISLRIVDPVTGRTERRHVPRLRAGDPGRSSWVTTFLGGACLVRRDAYLAVGGLPDEFFYAHEETSLAWRLLDAGYRIWYAGDLRMAHPALPPARHATYHHLTARNRVLLARKHLPAVLGVIYVLLWAVLGMVRTREGRGAALRGFRDGLTMTGVERSPMRWRTVGRMLRYGRPPLL
jgi:GT2 family glycosyltransferase